MSRLKLIKHSGGQYASGTVGEFQKLTDDLITEAALSMRNLSREINLNESMYSRYYRAKIPFNETYLDRLKRFAARHLPGQIFSHSASRPPGEDGVQHVAQELEKMKIAFDLMRQDLKNVFEEIGVLKRRSVLEKDSEKKIEELHEKVAHFKAIFEQERELRLHGPPKK